jgi:hypothetical protein
MTRANQIQDEAAIEAAHNIAARSPDSVARDYRHLGGRRTITALS